MRHGSTGFDGKYIGSTDLPVVPSAFAAVEKSGSSLRGKNIESVLCSPMLRCRQTLDRLDLACSVEYVDGLREVDFGEWEGKSFAEVNASHPETVKAWSQWSEEFTFPGGENMHSFLRRVRSVRRKVEDHPADSLLIVSHGGVIRQLICAFLCLPPSSYLLFNICAGFYSAIELYSEGGC